MNTYAVYNLVTKTGDLEVSVTVSPDGSSERHNADDTIRLTPSMTRKMLREMQRIVRMGDYYKVESYTFTEDEA